MAKFCFHKFLCVSDMFPNFERDPKASYKMKQQKKRKVGTCSLTHNTSGIKRHVGAPG